MIVMNEDESIKKEKNLDKVERGTLMTESK